MNRDAVQSEYFNSVKYRDPDDAVVSCYADPKMDFICRHAALSGEILDVGCGNGVFTRRLSRNGARVIGVDLSPPLLAQNRHPSLACADVLTLPFKDRSFDAVFEANILHHIDDRAAVVREMARVSRRYVILLEPNRNNPLMFGFSIVVKAERGGLKSTLGRLRGEIEHAGLRLVASTITGMISQNNTPRGLMPLLKRFDREIWWGEYIVIVAEK